MFNAIYDLGRSPPQYDFATFLVGAEIERIGRGARELHVVFLEGDETFRPADKRQAPPMDPEGLMARVARPICDLLPSVRSVTRSADRKAHKDQWGFGIGLYGFPRQLAALRSPHGRPFRPSIRPCGPTQDVSAEALAEGDERERGMITITLRESAHLPERNSAVAEWVEAARRLAAAGWDVVAVRDAARARETLDGVPTDPEAAVSIPARARLYTSARFNLFVNSGPMALALYLGAAVLNFRPVCETHRASSTEYLRHCGFRTGSQPPGSPARLQRYVWADDTADRIVAEVERAAGEGF